MTDRLISESPDATAGDDAMPDDGAAPIDAPEPEDPLAAAERERDEYRDLLLRKTAEFDNYRKRIERERREFVDTAAADLIVELLPILDDLQRALDADPGEAAAESYRRGVELIHQQLHDLLARRGVTSIDTAGARFDPHVHEAVVYEETPGSRDGEVVEELRRGYRLGDRLLRAAMVKVAKA